MTWDIVPICKAQLMDVNPEDLIKDGLYRKCNTYKGGGGYDKFPEIYNARFNQNRTDLNNQFVVQTKGCPLACPYCYVTKQGVNGESVKIGSNQLVNDFKSSKCSVFHLMGGAPALHLHKWLDLLSYMSGEVFHSDFLLLEGEYDSQILTDISSYKNSLYAVSIKGGTPEEFERNTARKFNESLFENNLTKLVDSNINFYFTFTGMTPETIELFKERHAGLNFDNSFAINLVHYKALDYIENMAPSTSG